MAASFCRRSFLNYKNCLFQTQRRTGYVVLIPETPEEVADFNVVSLENLPDFSKLDSNICTQIFHNYGQQYEVGSWDLHEHLEKQLKESKTVDVFKNVIEPLEILAVPLSSAWGVCKTLYVADNSRMPLHRFSPISEKVIKIRNEKFNRKSLYTACKQYLEEEGEKCSEEQRRILEKYVWEGTHSGFAIPEQKRVKLRHCFEILETKRRFYENKFYNSRSLFKQVIHDANFARDFPLDLLRFSAVKKSNPLNGPWLITLTEAVYQRYLEYCPSRDSRYYIWLRHNQLCSKFLDTTCNAQDEVDSIRDLRQEFAKNLGFPSFAHLSMKTKMAGSLENVHCVLSQLLEPAKCGQEKEITQLENFASEHDFNGSIELWDLPYWKRMERKHKLGLDEMTLKEYFPLSQVLLGLIALCEQLFSIEIEELPSVVTWDPDVRYFRVSDVRTKTILGGFYFDPYAREEKLLGEKNNGWFVTLRPRSSIIASLPVSALIFSFSPPTEEEPSLLYYREVELLFEKFGQMLQFTLNEMNYSDISGLSHIEWDALDICNKFLKFWLCEKGTLESISGHYKTGEPLPSHLVDNLCNIHRHMAGTELCRDIYFANLDLEIHSGTEDCMAIVDRLWPEHFLFMLHPKDQHPYGLKDLFINLWGAPYYSAVWSKMVAADIFYAFVEAGLNNQEKVSALGKSFRSTFLASGAGRNPSDIFRSFRGRDPDPKSLVTLLNLPTETYLSPDTDPQLALDK